MTIALNNTATIAGQYDGIMFDPQSASVESQILNASIAKSADPMIWVDGDLTYTVSVTNGDADLPLTNLELTDTLNTVLTFVEDSVTIDGEASTAYNYVEASKLLTIQVPDIPVATTSVITFRVTKE